jgi:undecaprenyl-diphosphatase
MDSLLKAFALSMVQGLTEFLPVSSSGHLIIAGELMGLAGQKIATFNVVIQLGSILSVALVYRKRFLGLLRPDPRLRFSGPRGIGLLMLTSFPACLVGFIAHSEIKERLFTPSTVALALGAGALCMLLVERLNRTRRPRFVSLDDITPSLALRIGLCQCLALWPGFSRSAATIMGGMLFGTGRGLAAEYSFIAAVPVMVAATGYDLLKNLSLFSVSDLPFFAVGMAGAFVSAWFAVKSFIALVGRMTLVPFALYRILLIPLIYCFMLS